MFYWLKWLLAMNDKKYWTTHLNFLFNGCCKTRTCMYLQQQQKACCADSRCIPFLLQPKGTIHPFSKTSVTVEPKYYASGPSYPKGTYLSKVLIRYHFVQGIKWHLVVQGIRKGLDVSLLGRDSEDFPGTLGTFVTLDTIFNLGTLGTFQHHASGTMHQASFTRQHAF